MSFVVPSEHPDGGQWNVRPTNSGDLHAVHSGTLEHFTAANQDEAKAAIAANEARYQGKDPDAPEVDPEPPNGGNGGNGDGEEPDEHQR